MPLPQSFGVPWASEPAPLAPAWAVSGLGAAAIDPMANYRARRDAATVAAQPAGMLPPVVLPEPVPFPRGLTIGLALAGLAGVGILVYAFTRRGR